MVAALIIAALHTPPIFLAFYLCKRDSDVPGVVLMLMVGLSWVWGIGMLFLPLSIYDAIKLRRLRVVHTEPALPEVRR